MGTLARGNAQREKAVADNLRLVHACAHRLKGRGIDYEELYSAGCLGLVKAVDAFDTRRGVRFSTYAVPVILGEMRRLFRDGGAVKVSRTLKELSLRIGRTRAQLCTLLNREPTISELAQTLDCSSEQITEALCATAPPVSLTVDDESGTTQLDVPVPSPEEMISEKLSLYQALESLESADRKIMVLRYFMSKTQTQTAALLGMTQVQVSRREKKILAVLRQRLL